MGTATFTISSRRRREKGLRRHVHKIIVARLASVWYDKISFYLLDLLLITHDTVYNQAEIVG